MSQINRPVLDAHIAPRQFDVKSAKEAFNSAAPYKHVVIDDFFDSKDALALHSAFPTFSRTEEIKSRLFSGRVYGPPPPDREAFARAFSALSTSHFTRKLSEISGVERLAMDETHAGAGAHVGLSGSKLPTHADHNTHPRAPWLYRRLNLLVYLNPSWERTWDGNLLLYDRAGTKIVTEIEPRFNRAILVEVHDYAFHAYRPLKLPPGQMRQLLAMYYYSPDRSPDQTVEPHPTLFATPADRLIAQIESGRRRLLHYIRVLTPKPDWGIEVPLKRPVATDARNGREVTVGGTER